MIHLLCYRLVPPLIVQGHLEPNLLYNILPLERHQVFAEHALER